VRCDPNAPTNCINGTLSVDTLLALPADARVRLNASGEFNPFKKISEAIRGIGYRVEAALIVPQRTVLTLTQGDLTQGSRTAGRRVRLPGNGSRGGQAPRS